jgi:hypothetical protein
VRAVYFNCRGAAHRSTISPARCGPKSIGKFRQKFCRNFQGY